MWIFGSLRRDALWIWCPALLGLIGFAFLASTWEHSALWALLVMGVLDSGHVYTTAWRTWFHAEERRSSARHWAVPLAIFVIFSLWFKAGVPGVWSFVVYATIYHNLRQFYGVLRWYEKLNGRFCQDSHAFFYAFTFGPVILYHFRKGAVGSYYTGRELFLMPSPKLLGAGLALYVLTVGAWFIFELRLARRDPIEWNRISALALPGLLYGFSFLMGRSREHILYPLLLAHGVTYIALVGLSLERTQRARFRSFARGFTVAALTAAIVGALEFLGGDYLMEFGDRYVDGNLSWLECFMGATLLTPLFAHYIFDAYLWTGRHREARQLFDASQAKKNPDPAQRPDPGSIAC